MPEYIYHVIGRKDMTYVHVDRYKFKRDTLQSWVAYQRGGERRFKKNNPQVFTDEDTMKTCLKRIKQQKLEEAKRQVKALSGPISMGTYVIPHEPMEPIS